MGEILWNPVSVTGTSNQLACRCSSFRKNSYGWRIAYWSSTHSLDFAFAIKPKRIRLVDGSSKIRSFAVSTRRTCSWDVSSGLHRSSNGEIPASGSEFEGVCRNEGEGMLTQRGREICFLEQELEPSCNFLVRKGLDVELGSENDLSGSSDKMQTENKIRIHFLEERNEEMLSKRLLRLSRLNKIRSALELFGSMKFSGLRPNAHACNSLLSCLLRNESLDKALIVFEFMRTNEIVTGHTYSLFLKAVAEIKGCDFALDMFTKLERDSKHKGYFDVILYNTVISICGRMNNAYDAERIWKTMKGHGHIGTEITYSLLVSIFVRCGRNELALDAYDEMIQNKVTPRPDAMQAIISACTKEGKWDLALNIFQSMLNNGLKPNLVACNALINLLGKAGRVELVFNVYGIAKSLGHEPDEYTWNALLTALYRANRNADVLQMFARIRTEKLSQPNEHLYNTALMSCQKLGSWERAVKILYEMESSGLSVSTSSYNLVIGACENARKPKVALQVYEHMLHRECSPDIFTHLSLVRSCIWGSMWNEVKEILKRVEPDVSLYNAAVHGMCLRGEIEWAKRLYMRMREIGLKPDGKTRALMLQNLKKVSS